MIDQIQWAPALALATIYLILGALLLWAGPWRFQLQRLCLPWRMYLCVLAVASLCWPVIIAYALLVAVLYALKEYLEGYREMRQEYEKQMAEQRARKEE